MRFPSKLAAAAAAGLVTLATGAFAQCGSGYSYNTGGWSQGYAQDQYAGYQQSYPQYSPQNWQNNAPHQQTTMHRASARGGAAMNTSASGGGYYQAGHAVGNGYNTNQGYSYANQGYNYAANGYANSGMNANYNNANYSNANYSGSGYVGSSFGGGNTGTFGGGFGF